MAQHFFLIVCDIANQKATKIYIFCQFGDFDFPVSRQDAYYQFYKNAPLVTEYRPTRSFYFLTYRVTLEPCDLWVIWSEWWGDMAWPKKDNDKDKYKDKDNDNDKYI